MIRVGPQGEEMSMWLLKTCSDFEGVEWMRHLCLVQNTGWDRSGQKLPVRFSVRCCNKPKWTLWPIHVSVFQGQESCSELNNFHASGLFYNSTPPSSGKLVSYMSSHICLDSTFPGHWLTTLTNQSPSFVATGTGSRRYMWYTPNQSRSSPRLSDLSSEKSRRFLSSRLFN